MSVFDRGYLFGLLAAGVLLTGFTFWQSVFDLPRWPAFVYGPFLVVQAYLLGQFSRAAVLGFDKPALALPPDYADHFTPPPPLDIKT